mmetsp:Transcript_65179/g.108250  ORF Transcript_65179/g.108250 Transcript_65179/m.108250 type:complete len:178 (-) Transcript_65179:163-696(-)
MAPEGAARVVRAVHQGACAAASMSPDAHAALAVTTSPRLMTLGGVPLHGVPPKTLEARAVRGRYPLRVGAEGRAAELSDRRVTVIHGTPCFVLLVRGPAQSAQAADLLYCPAGRPTDAKWTNPTCLRRIRFMFQAPLPPCQKGRKCVGPGCFAAGVGYAGCGQHRDLSAVLPYSVSR